MPLTRAAGPTKQVVVYCHLVTAPLQRAFENAEISTLQSCRRLVSLRACTIPTAGQTSSNTGCDSRARVLSVAKDRQALLTARLPVE